ncbi:site-specific DNA-methyltransferase [Burkholderia multivorans]|uniref:site-specific DNA-methyltransferase n=1 Tax=Burkholderia multivorans TaxID=87883 RepID=UPI000841F708|nr:site-specific DNA-methyltransferase [Burkholderia multivorans]AOJ91549.1 DNA methylase [Burkholderia multivorans]MBJ9939638.1 site-specific DNA-methyltransferase [Burkholderia multivorans]MBU9288529.1 site-specific DNA-methyltransferase [Burkholderia multivorans]MBU9444224.1 site-specific DNA-methyltransferase [Burkholderia multivorans]
MPFLDWVNKNQAKDAAREVPYHMLKREAIYGDASAAADNLIIQGDNLLALKALLPFYAGQVKCIFIDPPYNTQVAFEQYDDRLEHSQWLSMMYPRLVLLRDLLTEDGSIWVTIDDNEGHYLKVLMDEVFGRANFIATIAWEKDKGGRGDADISTSQDMILGFARQRKRWSETRNLLERTVVQAGRFKNPDNDPRGPWRQGDDGTAKSGTEKQRFPITLPSGRIVTPKIGRYWAFSQETFELARSEGRVYFGRKGDSLPVIKRYLTVVREGVAPRTWWPAEEAGTNQSAKRDHLAKLLPHIEPFATPKPEQLVSRILQISSNEGDLVLDSFLGSGTTAAVAQKMGRRYIGIETGEHARTHCIPRLEKVIAGEQGGISEAVEWKGGGGFSFLTLGEAAFDENGRINSAVEFSTLAAYIWHLETGTAGQQPFDSPLLGVHDGRAYFLLYNGILGDRRPAGGNVLNSAVLAHIRTLCPSPMPIVVYGETSRVGPARLAAEEITFRQIPYDISMR